MKDAMKPCQHTLSDDLMYKEVVIIGNGPSGMVTSFMLAGNVPYLKPIPADLPIDEMLRARLENLPPGQNLYEADLLALAEGLEGRSQNPMPLLFDNLFRPCADLGLQADSLIEWRFEIDKQVDHVVLGRGPPGGSWHTFPPGVRTLSPGAWLALPPHAAHTAHPPHAPHAARRLSARAVANYCRRYIHKCQLQRYFRSGVVVTRVCPLPAPPAAPCTPACPLHAAFTVMGYDKCTGRVFRYACRRVVVACGAADRPNTLEPHVARHALHKLAHLERALHTHEPPPGGEGAGAGAGEAGGGVLVVGSGVSAADAVWLCLCSGRRVYHVHRDPAAGAADSALASLDPVAYPDYCQVYKMMCEGKSSSHALYRPLAEHAVLSVTPLAPHTTREPLKRVQLLDPRTNHTKEITVAHIAVLIGSKPDLFFLQTNFTLECIDLCKCDEKHAKRRTEEPQCFLKNHWLYLKSVLGQSIQSCKSRYLNYTEINGNDTRCVEPNCNKEKFVTFDKNIQNCKSEIIPYEVDKKCSCQKGLNTGLGLGVDPNRPVDGRSNPIAIDKGSHAVLNAPEGLHALGPVTGDNFVRFIPGGALAVVSSIHKKNKTD